MSTLAVIALTIWATFSEKAKGKNKNPGIHVGLLWIPAILTCLSLFFQGWSAFHHYNYDTESIKYYDEKFDKIVMKRVSAATALKEFHEKRNWDAVTNSTDDLDYVLGVWDNLGYDEQHGKISAQVAWTYFYDDVANYYQGSKEYIADAQTNDPGWFENIKPLVDDLTKIQSKRLHRSPAEIQISEKDYLEYLRSEIDLKKEK